MKFRLNPGERLLHAESICRYRDGAESRWRTASLAVTDGRVALCDRSGLGLALRPACFVVYPLIGMAAGKAMAGGLLILIGAGVGIAAAWFHNARSSGQPEGREVTVEVARNAIAGVGRILEVNSEILRVDRKGGDALHLQTSPISIDRLEGLLASAP